MNLICIGSVYSLTPRIFELDLRRAPEVGKEAAFQKE